MSAITRIRAALRAIGPHANDLDRVFFLKNLIDEAMLGIMGTGCNGDSPRDRPVFRVFCVFRGYNTRGASAADLV